MVLHNTLLFFKKIDPYLTLPMKIHFRWIKHLNGKSESSNILKDNVRDYDVGIDFFLKQGTEM